MLLSIWATELVVFSLHRTDHFVLTLAAVARTIITEYTTTIATSSCAVPPRVLE